MGYDRSRPILESIIFFKSSNTQQKKCGGDSRVLSFFSVLCVLCVSLSFFLSLCIRARVYNVRNVRNTPPSYRQNNGNGQLLSRRYCKHSGRLYSCAKYTAIRSQGALAVSRKYFKQSKWPFSAAYAHTYTLYWSYLRSTRYSSMWR